MPMRFSRVIAARVEDVAGAFSVRNIDLPELGLDASPLMLVHDFRLRGRPFPPHPHAGFSPVSYVFEDSPGRLRSRDSLGNDLVMDPGGIIWTQAGRGLMHQELSADADRELHGVQFFVNVNSSHKLAPPQVLHLDPGEVPEWRNGAGDRVRIAVGSFEGISSPLVPIEPFMVLDVHLRHEIAVEVPQDYNALVYVLDGATVVRADDGEESVRGEQAVALHGDGRLVLNASEPAHVLLLAGAPIGEPVLVHGPFVMSNRSQLEAATARYQSGAMGRLAPLAAGD